MKSGSDKDPNNDNLRAVKRAIQIAATQREVFRTPILERLREAVRTTRRTIEDDKEILQLRKQIDAEREKLIEMLNANLSLTAKLDGTHAKTLRLVEEINNKIPALVAKAEMTGQEIQAEAIRFYQENDAEKWAVLVRYTETQSIPLTAKKTGFSTGKVHKLLKEVEAEQKREIINRRKPGGSHAGDHYKRNGKTRNRTHKAK